MTRTPQWTLALLAASLALAGCATPDLDPAAASVTAPPAAPPLTAEDGRDLRTELTAEDEVPAPQWQVGQRFRHHVFFGTGDGEGQHYDTIVVQDHADRWLLATDDAQVAKQHAILDIPILGDIRKDDLGMTGFGRPWTFYQFPLRHGAQWQVDFPNIAWDTIPTDTVRLHVTATYAPQIDTPAGPRPGFQMEARTDQGDLIADFDYVPDIGWYAHFTIYDIDPDQDPIEFRVTSMGHDLGWTGTYYIDTAALVLAHETGTGIDPDAPQEPFIEPAPHAAFTMSAQAEYLVGFVGVVAAAGAQELVIVPPDGQPYRYEAIGAPYHVSFVVLDEAAQPGDWTLLAAGAGGASIAFAELYEVLEDARTL